MSLVLRALIAAIAAMAAVVAYNVASTASASNTIETLASQLLQGASVDDDVLKAALSRSSRLSCASESYSRSAILELRLFDRAQEKLQLAEADRLLDSVIDRVRASLLCEPTRSFDWLLLFWGETFRGVEPGLQWDLLEMSYLTGPNEGWIAPRRSRLAFANFDATPDRIRTAAICEFRALLTSGFIDDAVSIYSHASLPTRALLDNAIQDLGASQRRQLADRVAAAGPTESLMDIIGGRTKSPSPPRGTRSP